MTLWVSENQLTRGYFICLVATVIWSTTGVLVRYLTESTGIPAMLLAFWRDLLVSLGLVVMISVLDRKLLRLPPGQLRFVAAYGLALALFNALWTISVALNGAAVSTVLAYSSAGFTALLGWRLLGEHLDTPKLLAVVLSLLGCALVAGVFNLDAWRLNLLGVLTGLISGLGFAAYSLFGRTASLRKMNSWSVMLYSFAWAAAFLLLFNTIFFFIPALNQSGLGTLRLLWLGQNTIGWLALALLALGPTILGYGLYALSLSYLPASVATLIATLEPSMTATLAYFFLGEWMTSAQFGGSVLILAGVVILRIYEGRAARLTPVAFYPGEEKIPKPG